MSPEFPSLPRRYFENPTGTLERMIFDRISTFHAMQPEHGINSFDLTTDNTDPSLVVERDVFSAVFPHFSPDMKKRGYDLMTLRISEVGIALRGDEIYQRIIEARIPQRLKDLPMLDDPMVRLNREMLMAAQGMPSILVTLGRIHKTGKNFIGIQAIWGISPGEALELDQKLISACRRI